ncbi:MAG: ribonuclease P protein subunit [Nanoarchaeota archaeon]|nr:ribonuclease P protein subunit [Nanoarchaeota archaeon]
MEKQQVVQQELIGCPATVVDATNKSLVGLQGKIVDETKYVLVIANGEEKKVLKAHATFKITMKNKTYVIKGAVLVGRPEDRLKKKVRL